MGEFGFIQTVEDNMKLFSKRQIASAARAKDLYEKMIFPSTADFRAIASAGRIPGCEVTPEDVKSAKSHLGLLSSQDERKHCMEECKETCSECDQGS
jgi:hypothetical protein